MEVCRGLTLDSGLRMLSWFGSLSQGGASV